MNANLSAGELQELKQQLHNHEHRLLDELEAGKKKADSGRFAQLAGEVPDAGDASVADVEIDSASAERTRDSEELAKVRQALARIEAGAYGVCLDCGRPIPLERLRVFPWARYDIEHESQREQGVRTPSL